MASDTSPESCLGWLAFGVVLYSVALMPFPMILFPLLIITVIQLLVGVAIGAWRKSGLTGSQKSWVISCLISLFVFCVVDVAYCFFTPFFVEGWALTFDTSGYLNWGIETQILVLLELGVIGVLVLIGLAGLFFSSTRGTTERTWFHPFNYPLYFTVFGFGIFLLLPRASLFPFPLFVLFNVLILLGLTLVILIALYYFAREARISDGLIKEQRHFGSALTVLALLFDVLLGSSFLFSYWFLFVPREVHILLLTEVLILGGVTFFGFIKINSKPGSPEREVSEPDVEEGWEFGETSRRYIRRQAWYSRFPCIECGKVIKGGKRFVQNAGRNRRVAPSAISSLGRKSSTASAPAVSSSPTGHICWSGSKSRGCAPIVNVNLNQGI